MRPTASTASTAPTTLDAVLAERFTCRQFTETPVPRSVIEDILRLAQRTPSWNNTQPWQVHVTSGQETDRFRAALLEHVAAAAPHPDFDFPVSNEGVFAQRRRECGGQLYQSLGIERGDEAAKLTQLLRNFELFDAPHVAVVTTEAGLGVYGAVDAGLYLGTFLLAAQSRGVATAAQAAIAAYSPFVREHFGIPDGRRMVAGISFGYAAESPVNGFRTTRAEIDEVVTWVDG